MRIECTACGAPIDVQPGARMVACRYCGSANQLEAPQVEHPPPPRLRPLHIALVVGGLGALPALGSIGLYVSRGSSEPEPVVQTPLPASGGAFDAGPPPAPEAPRVSTSVQMGACLGDHDDDGTLDLAGLYQWTDDLERHFVSVIDGASGQMLWRGEELPRDSKVLCGRHGHFAFGTPDFKLRLYTPGETEPVVRQLTEAVGHYYAAGETCYAIKLANDEVVSFSYAGEPADDCEAAPARIVNIHRWGGGRDARTMLGRGGSSANVWVGVQDGVSYVVETAASGTPIITVTARRGDVSEELAEVDRATAYFIRLLPNERDRSPFEVTDEAGEALRIALEHLDVAWTVRLAIAGDMGTFVALLTPDTLVVHGKDPAGGDEPYRLVGVALSGGSIRYTAELDHDVFTLQHNGRWALADGRGHDYAFDPDTAERAWELGM